MELVNHLNVFRKVIYILKITNFKPFKDSSETVIWLSLHLTVIAFLSF